MSSAAMFTPMIWPHKGREKAFAKRKRFGIIFNLIMSDPVPAELLITIVIAKANVK
jgi:hypothetical protein